MQPTAQQVADHIKQLEQQAEQAHREGQTLNKAGRFEEAKAQYALMSRLEAAALQLSKEAGCPACIMAATGGGPAQAGGSPAAGCQQPQAYRVLHVPCSWQEACRASGADPSQAAQRARGAILGSAVGDAAAMGVQWIYDTAVLRKLLDQRLQQPDGADWGLAFFEPPSSPFLPADQYSTGRFSPYFEPVAVLLGSVAERGGLDCNHYAAACAQAFGDGFEGYINASMRGFLRAHSQGEVPPTTGVDDKQADCVARLAPLLAAFAGDAQLPCCVEAATRVTQNDDEAVAWALAGAAVLELLVMGQQPRQAVQAAIDELQAGRGRFEGVQHAAAIAGHFQQAVELRAVDHQDVVEKLGRNCHVPNSCQTPLHALLHAEWRLEQQTGGSSGAAPGVPPAAAERQQVYKHAIQQALAGGGCCASRACYAGACLGAWLGPDAVPAEWAAKVGSLADVTRHAEAIVALRQAGGSS